MTPGEILRTEFSEDFVSKMKARMVTSFYKYGPLALNFNRACKADNCGAILNLHKRLALYAETGNTEWLVDVANLAMIEFMYPQHDRAHFRATDSRESPGADGLTVREIEQLTEEQRP